MKEPQSSTIQFEQAALSMLDEFRDNVWMLNEHWPLNKPHVRLMVEDIMTRFPPGPDVRILDVGCFNGYISILLKNIGYQVTATDAYTTEQSAASFERAGIAFMPSNMNELNPFNGLPRESFDIVIIAQVIEHILNYPIGLIRKLSELMRKDGLMILTTPNPATVMAAVRVLRGQSLLWGTRDFIIEPKIDGDRVITKADIHYREYTREEVRHMLIGAGLRVENSRYLGLGNSQSQSALKKFIKGNALTQRLMSKRLFASNHYFLARKV
jgi:2-polyprenyl-3-methyl-5-hydroxy-6-metoxy-1,4-benzoquinol methylase